MKIGVLAPDLSGGHGWSHLAIAVMRGWRALGVELKIVTTLHSPDHAEFEVVRLLPEVAPLQPRLILNMLKVFPQVKAFLEDCDVIHSFVELFAPLAVAIGGKRPVSISGCGTYVNLPRMRRFPVNWLYKWSFERAHLTCISRYTANVAQEVSPRSRIHIAPLCIDSTRYTPLTLEKAARPTVMTVGGVKPRKGTLEFIETIARVRDHVPTVQAWIVGNVPQDGYSERVKQAIATHHLENVVTLSGFVDEATLHQLYSQAHVFALPSVNHGYHFEGFGLVHLEASAMGLPVVGARGCGVEDAIQEGITGLLVPQESLIEDMAQAIVRLLQQPEYALRIGKQGRLFAESRTWQDVAREMLAVF